MSSNQKHSPFANVYIYLTQTRLGWENADMFEADNAQADLEPEISMIAI